MFIVNALIHWLTGARVDNFVLPTRVGLKFVLSSFWRNTSRLALVLLVLSFVSARAAASCTHYTPDPTFSLPSYTVNDSWSNVHTADGYQPYTETPIYHWSANPFPYNPLNDVAWAGLNVTDVFEECSGVFRSASGTSAMSLPTPQNGYHSCQANVQAASGVVNIRVECTATQQPDGSWPGGTVTSYYNRNTIDTVYTIKTGALSQTYNGSSEVYWTKDPLPNGVIWHIHGTNLVDGKTSGAWAVNQTSDLTAKNIDLTNNPKANEQCACSDRNAPGIPTLPSVDSKDPVNLATGMYYETLRLMDVAAASPLQFNISYRSDQQGWSHNYQYTFIDSGAAVNLTWPDAHESIYKSIGAGLYSNWAADAQDRLVKKGDGSFDLTDRRKKTYTFSAAGRLQIIRDRYGFNQALTYLGNGNLDKVTDVLSGRFLQFAYDAQNRVSSVSSAGAGAVTLAYSAGGDLASVTDPLGNVTSFTYDANHRLLTKINALGATVVTNSYDNATGKVLAQDDGLPGTALEQFSYGVAGAAGNPYSQYVNRTGGMLRNDFDSKFNVLSTIDPLGNAITRTYDPITGMQALETDALSATTQFTYDASGYVLTRSDALGNVARYAYDAAHNIVSDIDEAGRVTTMTYDANNRLLTKTDPAAGITAYTYNGLGLVATITSPMGGVTTYSYDAKGQLANVSDPVGSATSFTYDAAGRSLTTTDGAGKVWARTYDLMGRVLTKADPLGNTTRYTYDALGRLTTSTAPNGGVTRYAYDIHDKLVTVTNPLNAVSGFSYDADERPISVTNALGYVTTFTRDAKGRLTAVTDALGNTTASAYDAVDNVISKSDALNNVTLMMYDKLHRLTSVTDPLSGKTGSSYDVLSRAVTNTDAKAGVTTFAYDALSYLISTTDTRGGVASQTFDGNGNRLSFTDALGHKTTFTYDAASRVKSVATADGGTTTYTYNSRNLAATATNARGQLATYGYDNAGRLVSLADPAGTISITYDANGNILTIGDAVGTSTYTYDLADRAISYTDVFGNRIAYGYDAVGNLITLTYPGGKVVTYTYDAANRMTSVRDWANRLTSYMYNARGDLIATTRANGTGGAYTYDAKGQLASLTETFPDIQNSYATAFSYDPNGNITSEVRTPPVPAPALVSGTSNMTYGADNRLATWNGQAVGFDADGNMTSGWLHGAAATLAFDARSRLTSVAASSFVYNAQDIRVAATNAGVTTRYVVDPTAGLSRVLMETTPAGAPIAFYVYGPAGLIGRESSAGAYQTYHYDFRGSTVKLADIDGAVTDTYMYGAYGELGAVTGTTSNPFKYNGRDGVMTDATDLYYMRARYYSTAAKRFVNRDVLLGDVRQPVTLNRYAYVGGNPVSFIDPTGLICTYSQRSGAMSCTDAGGQNYYNAPGYAGTGAGRNNPDAQGQGNVGPLPRGDWQVTGDWYNSPNTGRNTVRLMPMAGNDCGATGRICNTFRIHGDNARNDASHGCIVLPPNRTVIPPGEVIRVVP